MRLWEMICKTLGEDLVRSRESLGEDSQGFVRLWESICKDETLGEDLQGFTSLWERICKDL